MPHFEKYKVVSKSKVGNTITFGVQPMSVPDTPVDDISFRDFLPGGCPTLTGVENPVDDTAVIYTNHTDWTDVDSTIKINTYFVRYLSTEGASASVENITNVSWGKI
ncbi:MAG TPA: hypothetical protein VMG12_18800 [Polyangiaceae bacterium]|nr:hypothetical protein [Polyangiaceae bacterium]